MSGGRKPDSQPEQTAEKSKDWIEIMADEERGNSKSEKEVSGSASSTVKKSWSSVLGASLPKRDNNNVLEVSLQKDTRGAFYVNESECFNMMRKLGLDPRPGIHVEGVQICPQGRGVIYITLMKEVNIDRFCRYDVLEVTQSGIRTSLVKPAYKKEVIVTAKGIHPNTKETVVLDYLGKFGKVFTGKVVYGLYPDGPLKGFKNGDRSYKMEMKPGAGLGSYHVIDNQKVTIRYPGQQQTCARCHQTPQNCKGRGLAKRCEAEGGQKLEFTDYILNLWKTIGYSPDNLDLSQVAENDGEGDDSVQKQEGGSFTPPKVHVIDAGKFRGVVIKPFPKNIDQGQVIEFIVKSGLPEGLKESIRFGNNGAVTVEDLDNVVCLALIEAVHGTKHFGKKLFCNGILPLTPEKRGDQGEGDQGPVPHDQPLSTEDSGDLGDLVEEPVPPAQPQFPLSENQRNHSQYFEQSWSFSAHDFPNLDQVVRRYSLSLENRSPPRNSIAADLLHSKPTRAEEIIADIKETLSDFNSCQESLSELSGSSDEGQEGLGHALKTVNEKKRDKKKKKKAGPNPRKGAVLEKG